MSHFAKLLAVPIVFFLGACENSGANYTPVIDGPVSANYNADLSQCQALAASGAAVDERTAAAVATGAVVGGASSVIWNDNSSKLGEAAAVGAVVGLASGLAQKSGERESIVKNCMRGRGYNVVG
ncbi:MAG: hypothetical protein ACI92Z_002231 [Paracoccaceae bacterium]|jgi:hypothetical protein